MLRINRMRLFRHVERSTGWIADVRKLSVVEQEGSGRPRKIWDEVLVNERKKLLDVWILLSLRTGLRLEDAFGEDFPTIGREKTGL